ncbi:MAG TPA: porin PorA family protein [Jatrophihabitantaceae bacterium]|jgi:hypothetical protein
MRKSSVWLISIGLVLQALAAVVAFVIAPALMKLPGDTDLTVKYSGTADVLNAAAMAKGDLAHAFVKGAPASLDRRVHVTASHGNTAVVADEQNLHVGTTTSDTKRNYAVDRSTMRPAAAPKGDVVEPAHGLTVSFPIDLKAGNSYRLYDATTQLSTPLTYTGKATVSGREVYRYTTTATGPVKDAALTASLPQVLPKALLVKLGAATLPAAVQAQLAPVVAQLPDLVPLHYTATTKVVAAVDSATGVVIDQAVTETVTPSISLGAKSLPLPSVLSLDLKATPSTVQAMADKAASAGRMITAITVVVPFTLVAIGLVFEIVAIVRRRKPQSPAVVTGGRQHRDLATAGR